MSAPNSGQSSTRDNGSGAHLVKRMCEVAMLSACSGLFCSLVRFCRWLLNFKSIFC
jgi:hypothetical protein